MFKSWETKLVTVVEIEFDQDLHEFQVFSNETDELLGVITPSDMEDMEEMRADLDEGKCPIADKWDDGLGGKCSLKGWG